MTSTSDYIEALEEILRADRLDIAKEIAADILDVTLEEFIEYDIDSSFDEDEGVTPKDVLSLFE